MLTILPTSIKDYIMCFLPLEEYNHLYLLVKIKPNYKLYFKTCPDEIPYSINNVCMSENLINLNLIKYLHNELHLSCSESAISYASYYGHINIVKFLNNLVDCLTTAIDWACLRGHLDIIKFLHYEVKAKCTPSAIDFASERGYLEIVKFLHYELKVECMSNYALYNATLNNHLEVVKFLCNEMKAKYTNDLMYYAQNRGHVEIVKFFKEIEKQKN